MCFDASNVKGLLKWNWDGDVIIHQPIVPSGRKVVGVRSRRSYNIDVREYLTSTHNAVMQQVVRETLPRYIKKHGGSVARFEAHKQGSFDYRAAAITNFVADTIEYQSGRGRDPWQFPDETLAIKAGDCEDRAFLLASLMLAAGISTYNIRVAFGKMIVDNEPHDHMWVMYKNERGNWNLVEPLRIGRALSDDHIPATKDKSAAAPQVEYEPHFLFNDSHLWAIKDRADRDSLDIFLHREWSRLNPKFVGQVHMSIIEEAICGVPGTPSWVLKELKRNFTRLFLAGPIVDSIDLDISDYSPLDHFDNGYIDESWDRVSQNLASFREDSRTNLQSFARAAHAIADFYAHSSYMHFAQLVDPGSPQGHAEINDPPGQVAMNEAPSYEPPSTFDLTNNKFSINESLWKLGKEAAARRWANRLISGRYAQPDDTQPGLTNHLTEGLTNIPKELKNASGFSDRGSLPHHNQIAVDDSDPGKQHCLYRNEKQDETDPMAYENQLRWRKNTAVLHVRKAFSDNFTGHGDQ
ncbi:MAG TPA: transglutaminase-like domain-containing protein [Dissulfurispiraceae bacterium]|nr:transglutaminase-like domain-containing protein [Dissulfurispiraceae bacterium]